VRILPPTYNTGCCLQAAQATEEAGRVTDAEVMVEIHRIQGNLICALGAVKSAAMYGGHFFGPYIPKGSSPSSAQ
jgi:hypothetical protein